MFAPESFHEDEERQAVTALLEEVCPWTSPDCLAEWRRTAHGRHRVQRASGIDQVVNTTSLEVLGERQNKERMLGWRITRLRGCRSMILEIVISGRSTLTGNPSLQVVATRDRYRRENERMEQRTIVNDAPVVRPESASSDNDAR